MYSDLLSKDFRSKSIDPAQKSWDLGKIKSDKLSSPKIHLKNIFLIACSIFAPKNIHQIARFQLEKKKSSVSRGHMLLWCEFLCFSSFLSELTGHSRNLVGGWGLVQLRFWSYISSMPVSLFVQVYSLKPGKLHVAQNRCKGGWAWSNI